MEAPRCVWGAARVQGTLRCWVAAPPGPGSPLGQRFWSVIKRDLNSKGRKTRTGSSVDGQRCWCPAQNTSGRGLRGVSRGNPAAEGGGTWGTSSGVVVQHYQDTAGHGSPILAPPLSAGPWGSGAGSGVVRASPGVGLPRNKLRASLRAPKSCVSASSLWGGDGGEMLRSLPQNKPGRAHRGAARASPRARLPQGAAKAQSWQPLILGSPLLGFWG